METVVGFIMLAIIVFLLVSNKTSIIPVFGILPILAAMALGYGIKDIQKFMLMITVTKRRKMQKKPERSLWGNSEQMFRTRFFWPRIFSRFMN